MPRAIALIRVSTEAQAGPDRYGLEAQRAEVGRIAARYGLELVEEVALLGVSGAAVLEDPRYQRLLSRLSDPDVDGVVVAEFSRLMRPEEPGDYLIIGRFRAAGKVLWTPEGPRDMRAFGGRLLSVLQGELAAYEREQIRDRTTRGKEEMRRQGRHPGPAHTLPHAVAYDRTSHAWSYRWPQAGVIREAYRRVLAGERNLAALARSLGLDKRTMTQALAQPLYRGVRRWAKGRAPEDVLERRVIDPPLVTDAEWWAVQILLEGRPAPTHHHGPPWQYAGLLECDACGSRLYALRSQRWGTFYRCQSQSRQRPCPTGQVKQSATDAAADSALSSALCQPEAVSALIDAAQDAAGEAIGAHPGPEDVARRIAALEAERERVLRGYEAGLRGMGETQGRVREIAREAEELRRCSEAEPEAENTFDAGRVALSIARVFKGWRQRTWAERREIAQASIRALYVARAGRARVSVPAVDLWLPALSPSGGVHPGRPDAARWLRLRLAA